MDPVTGILFDCFFAVGAQMAERAGYVKEQAAQPCLAVVQCVVEEETSYQKCKRLHEKGEVISRLRLGPRKEEPVINYRKQEEAEVRSILGLGHRKEEPVINYRKQEEAEVISILGL